jgi:hypothetical protein
VGKFVLVYTGGAMQETEAAQQEAMTQWMSWFGSLGDAVVDAGSPFGPSSSISSKGTVSDGGKANLSGYSIVSADSLADAADKAKGCPVLAGGGGVEVYEAMPIG